MNRLEGWLVHAILSYLPPRDLLAVADTCKWLRAYALTERLWTFDRNRVLDRCPELIELFEPPGDANAKRTNGELFPPGSWRTFLRYLCRDKLDTDYYAIAAAICRMSFQSSCIKWCRVKSYQVEVRTHMHQYKYGEKRQVSLMFYRGDDLFEKCAVTLASPPNSTGFVGHEGKGRKFYNYSAKPTPRDLISRFEQFIGRQAVTPIDWGFRKPYVSIQYDALYKLTVK